VNFYISSENAKNLDISATERLISTKFGMMIQNVFQVRRPLKKSFKKIQDGGRPMRLRDPFCIIMRYCNLSIFKITAVRHLRILKLKFLTAMHFRDTFCVISFNFVEIGETSHFLVFRVKCKNSLDDHA